MIRLLPCKTCGHAKLQNGNPYWLGVFPEIGQQKYYTYECYGCRGQKDCWVPQSITLHEFNALPYITGQRLVQLGIEQSVLRDLLAQGLTVEQAIQRYDAAELQRGQPA